MKGLAMIILTIAQLSGNPDKTQAIACTIYGESSICNEETKHLVASVIWNRSDKPINDIALADACLKPGAFCCYKHEYIEIDISSQAWRDCKLLAAQMVSGKFKPSTDATFFLSASGAPPHSWGAVTYVKTIGGLRFWKGMEAK